MLLSCGNALVTTNDGDRPPWTEEPEGAAGRRQARRPLLAIGRSRGLDEKIFLLNSGQAPGPRQGESVRSRDETRQGVMSKKKNAEAAVTRGLCSRKEPIAPSGSASARALSAGERGAWTEKFSCKFASQDQPRARVPAENDAGDANPRPLPPLGQACGELSTWRAPACQPIS